MKHLISNYSYIDDLPEGAERFFIHLGRLWTDETYHRNFMKQLPKGNWSVVGWSDEITEADWMNIVEKNGEGYEHYMTDEEYDSSDSVSALSTAKESGHNLLKSKGIEKRVLILKNEV